MNLLADKETQDRRKEKCRVCPHASGPSPQVKLFCSRCNCVIAGKVILQDERCPEGQW